MVQNGHTVQWRQRNGKPVEADDISGCAFTPLKRVLKHFSFAEIAEEEEIVNKGAVDRNLTSLPPVRTAFNENIYTEPHQACSSQTSSSNSQRLHPMRSIATIL